MLNSILKRNRNSLVCLIIFFVVCTVSEAFCFTIDSFLGKNLQPKNVGALKEEFFKEKETPKDFIHSIPYDASKAVSFCERYSESGDVTALIFLGRLYECGIGVKKSEDLAAKCYSKAVILGSPKAQFLLGDIYFNRYIDISREKNTKQNIVQNYGKWAFDYFCLAADQGYIPAIVRQGDCYARGLGVERSYDKAFANYETAASKGNALGMIRVGDSYFNGLVYNKFPVDSIKWYKKAFEAGDSMGAVKLGLCSFLGMGFKTSYKQAAYYYKKAADMGNPLALTLLGNCYSYGRGVEPSDKEAFKLYYKAAEMNFVTAMYCVADCFMYGKGVEKSKTEAESWLNKTCLYDSNFKISGFDGYKTSTSINNTAFGTNYSGNYINMFYNSYKYAALNQIKKTNEKNEKLDDLILDADGPISYFANTETEKKALNNRAIIPKNKDGVRQSYRKNNKYGRTFKKVISFIAKIILGSVMFLLNLLVDHPIIFSVVCVMIYMVVVSFFKFLYRSFVEKSAQESMASGSDEEVPSDNNKAYDQFQTGYDNSKYS